MIDKLIDKFFSRKFLVWICSCFLLMIKVIDQQTWLYITIFYVGTEGLADVVSRFRK